MAKDRRLQDRQAGMHKSKAFACHFSTGRAQALSPAPALRRGCPPQGFGVAAASAAAVSSAIRASSAAT
jgi:hypothetical protein